MPSKKKTQNKIVEINADPAPTPAPAPDSESNLEIQVRLLSGDILRVMTSVHSPLKEFVKEFAEQHGYNPIQLDRIDLLIESEPSDDAKEEAEKGYVPLIRDPQETWNQRFPSGVYPLVHLLIQPPKEDPEKEKKMELLREVLDREKRMTSLSNDELYNLFSEWNLTYRPPPKTNRYKNLLNFVCQSEHLFPPLTEEALMEFKKQYEEIRQEYKRLSKEVVDFMELTDLHNKLALQRRELALDMLSPEYAATRELRIAEYRTRLEQDPSGTFVNETSERYVLYMNPEDVYLATPNPSILCCKSSCNCIWSLLKRHYRRECDLRAEHGEDISVVLAEMFQQARTTRYEYLCKNDAILRRKLPDSI